jgi:predicted HicB family RNase H-like nuclease
MSAKVDQFCEKLTNRLNALADQLETLKENVKQLPKEGEQALQKYLSETRSRIAQRKKSVEQVRASLMTRAEQKIGQVKEAIIEWKTKGEVSKLNARADWAEQYAADAVFIAMAALADAEEATIDALIARIEAEEAEAPAAAAR